MLIYTVDEFDEGIVQRKGWSYEFNDIQYLRYKPFQESQCTWEKQAYKYEISLLERAREWRKNEIEVLQKWRSNGRFANQMSDNWNV